MIYSIPKEDTFKQLVRQLESNFLLSDDEKKILDKYYDMVLERCEYCFSKTPNKYYHNEGNTYFNPYVTTQYVVFLYFFANTIYREESTQRVLCDKLYFLNKIMNGLDLFYEVMLPDFFQNEHPVGSVLGEAKYGQGFLFYQNCTVGGFHLPQTIVYPVIGENVHMYSRSAIIGNCKIGDNVNIGAGAMVKNEDIPDNCNVFGQSPNLIIKPRKNRVE